MYSLTHQDQPCSAVCISLSLQLYALGSQLPIFLVSAALCIGLCSFMGLGSAATCLDLSPLYGPESKLLHSWPLQLYDLVLSCYIFGLGCYILGLSCYILGLSCYILGFRKPYGPESHLLDVKISAAIFLGLCSFT